MILLGVSHLLVARQTKEKYQQDLLKPRGNCL